MNTNHDTAPGGDDLRHRLGAALHALAWRGPDLPIDAVTEEQLAASVAVLETLVSSVRDDDEPGSEVPRVDGPWGRGRGWRDRERFARHRGGHPGHAFDDRCPGGRHHHGFGGHGHPEQRFERGFEAGFRSGHDGHRGDDPRRDG